MIPFIEWLPDQPVHGNQGNITAKNVVPGQKGYKPLKSLNNLSDALTAYARGYFVGQDKDGNRYNYAADATKIYVLGDNTFTAMSHTAYATGSEDSWNFIQWGQTVIGTNYADNIQSVTLGSTTPSDLSANAPKAKYITTVGDFVVVANTNDGVDGKVPNRVRWCGINDSSTWVVSATTQADYQDIADGGAIFGITGDQERGTIFQRDAIWVMTYVGSPIIFDFTKLPGKGVGLYSPKTLQTIRGASFFLSQNGFQMLEANGITPIGANKVDDFVLNDFDGSYWYRATAAIDPINKIYMCAYPGNGNVSGLPNKLVTYNWSTGRWGYGEIETELLIRYISPGFTLEQLDNISASIDALPASLDSSLWAGGDLNLGAFDSSHKLSTFTGTALDVTIETGEFQPFGDNYSEVLEVRPIIDGGTHSVQMGSRNLLTDSVSWGTEASENSTGFCPVRSNSRYHRIRVKNTGDFENALGVEVKATPTGDR